ncbi:flagellar filament capping protein FliD [Sulfuricurvum sp.]|uniref:flagellar filament capping protein FliD n=1 Tax=Sulfuricurvum sp. TaxID=2025608 RepID=UPI003BB73976
MAVSSLGAGSGVLTSTVIDQLKAADTTAIITPITNKITLETKKSSALSLVSSLLTTFQANASALNDDTLYQGRSVSGSTDAVSVTANAGVTVQSFSISDTSLALNNIKESGSFTATSSLISSGSGTLTLGIASTSYSIDYTASTTLETLKDAINSAAGSVVKASTLQVGTNDYRLVLSSVATGEDQAITLSDSSGGTLDSKLLAYHITTNPTGMQDIQTAQDASFKYDGITITRSSNTITDITPGMTINLLQNSGSANIAITQNTTAISDAMSSFVTSYNSLNTQITSLTTSDTTAGTIGVFNGDSSIYGITRAINQIVTSVSSDGFSLPQFGIDLAEDGTMSFDSSIFLSKFDEDTTAAEAFFRGTTTIDSLGNSSTTDGMFTSLDTLLTSYTTASSGIMATLTSASSANITSLNTNKTRSQALLDARYEAMTARFVQYDAIMTKLTNQFSSLKNQISMAINGS